MVASATDAANAAGMPDRHRTTAKAAAMMRENFFMNVIPFSDCYSGWGASE
jgi:hypothetical protein